MELPDIIYKLENLKTFDEKLDFLGNISALSQEIADDEMKAIEQIQKKLFKNKPILGANKWFITKCIQILPNIILVYMEDGHTINIALIDKGKHYKTVWENIM